MLEELGNLFARQETNGVLPEFFRMNT